MAEGGHAQSERVGGIDRWLISSDSHVIEVPDLWTSRVPARLRDLAPHVERGDGADWWVFDGRRTESYSGPSAAGLRFDGGPDALDRDLYFEDAMQGGYVPAVHVADNESDGVWASVIYPSFGITLYSLSESELLSACARAYNEWVAEFCATAPDRLRGVAILNVDDVDEAVAELRRARADGLGSAAIPVAPRVGYDDRRYDPLWAAAEETRTPLTFHIGTLRHPHRQGRGRAELALQHRYVESAIAHLVFGHVFEDFPSLDVVSVEFEFGWAPHLLAKMDTGYLQRRHWAGRVRFRDGMLPSDFVRRSVWFSFQEDEIGLRLRDILGTDHLLWGSDYPHGESTFPRSRTITDALLADLTPDERAAVTCDNAARLYGMTVPR